MRQVKKVLTKKYVFPFDLSESTVSMILGGIVVILVGLIAFNFFRAQRENAPVAETPEVKIEETTNGQLGGGKLAVALPTTHTVAKDETIWGIAEKYYGSGFNSVDIISANKLSNPSVIEIGQKLVIPKAEVKEKTTLQSESQPVVTDSKITGDNYKILSGDDLWDIAVRAYGDGYKWVEIAKANNLANPDLIHVDNVLTIPRK